MTDTSTVDHLFAGKAPGLRPVYDHLIQQLDQIGPVKVAPKTTSIHLEKNGGFAGIHPRKNSFNLIFRTDRLIQDPRITKVERLSAGRYMHTVPIERASDVDDQLLSWLQEAYELAR